MQPGVQPRHVNLVFQGGGIRGIAYAGALESMPDFCHIHAVAGTSAGAIVAGLLAIGKNGSELGDILRDPAMFKLLRPADSERTQRLVAVFKDLRALLRDTERLKLLPLLRLQRKHKHIFEDIRTVWKQRGLHQSGDLREWLERVFGQMTFGDIILDDLKIVAADVSSQKYVIYDRERNKGMLIAEAVHASVSIPIFFCPYMNGPNHFVDGGIL